MEKLPAMREVVGSGSFCCPLQYSEVSLDVSAMREWRERRELEEGRVCRPKAVAAEIRIEIRFGAGVGVRDERWCGGEAGESSLYRGCRYGCGGDAGDDAAVWFVDMEERDEVR